MSELVTQDAGRSKLPLLSRRGTQWVCVILFLLFLMWFVEMVARGSLLQALTWTTIHPVESLVTLAMVGCILSTIAAMAGLRLGALLTLSALSLLSAIHATKKSVVGQPLFPWDLLLSRQAADVFGEGYFPHSWRQVLVFLIAFVALACMAWYLLPRPRLRLWQRGLLLVIGPLFLCGIAFYRSTPVGLFINREGIWPKDWAFDQPTNYNANGFPLAFTMNMQMAIVTAPDGYDNQYVQDLLLRLDQHAPLERAAAVDAPSQPPDLIIVMSESLWDVTLLPTVTFEPDPLSFLHGLPQHQRGWLVSPAMGGWTCNAEFELLTGFSLAFLPRGAVPYQQYIRRPLPALPQILADAGYRSLAIHPYYRWFWNRDIVYPLLGFQQFLALEDYDDPPTAGPYATDDWLTDQIIQQLDTPRNHPLFLFAITMQNHGPYDHPRYEPAADDIHVQCDLPPESQQMLSIYAHGVRDADRMLEALVKYVDNTSRPTLLLFFGDHLPGMGRVYAQTGFADPAAQDSWQTHYRLHRVPAAYNANFLCDRLPSEVSISMLGPWILRQIGIEPPVSMRMTEAVSMQYPIIAETWLMDAAGTVHTFADLPEGILTDYRMLQYDLMFGSQYSQRVSLAARPAGDKEW